MSQSTHVVGFIPPGDDWKRKVAALRACRTAGVEPPRELEDYLGLDPGEGQEPSEHGREIGLDRFTRRQTGVPSHHESVTEYSAEMRDGFDIDISKLPPEIKVIRVYTSY